MIDKIIFKKDHEEVYKTGVYKVFHISSPEDFYIGSTSKTKGRKGTIGFSSRFYSHLADIKKDKHHSKKLMETVKRFGIDGVRMQILELCEPDKCRDFEQEYLNRLQPSFNTYKNSICGLGHKHSEEARQRMSIGQIGRKLTDDQKSAISNRMKGKKPKNLPTLHTKENREKAAATLRGFKHTSEIFFNSIRTQVFQFQKDGTFIKKFESVKSASEYTGIYSTSISLNIFGHRPSAGGFIWSQNETPPDYLSDKKYVLQKDLSGKLLNVFETITDAAKYLNIISLTSIRSVLSKKQNKAYNSYWEYLPAKEALRLGISISKFTK